MASRKSFMDTAKSNESHTFAANYKWSKVAKMEPGVEKYVLFLGLDQGIFSMPRHYVKTKSKDNGFQSKYNTEILCKSYDENGQFIEEAECCKQARLMKEKYPNQEDMSKRIIGAVSEKLFFPVLILGNSEVDPNVKGVPVQKLSLKTYQFAYLDMSKATWNSILSTQTEKLKTEEDGWYDLKGEELLSALLDYVKNSVVKITAVKSNKGLPYEKLFTFIPFKNQNIGKNTDEYKVITNYTKWKPLNEPLTDFMTLFEAEVDNLINSKWTAEALRSYVEGPSDAQKRVDEIQTNIKKADEFLKESDADVILDPEEIPFGEDETTNNIDDIIDEVQDTPELTDDDTTYSVETSSESDFFD